MIDMTKVINDLVGYNNIKIVQNKDYFNFSLESIVLPRFCEIRKNMKIMDLCTGNAPIPLVLSTLTEDKIIGIEVQKSVYDLAVESVKLNNLEKQIQIINMNVKDIFDRYETDSFDLITCNPPYFKVVETSNINENEVKSIARHEILVTLDDILNISKKLLKNGGSLTMVHRTDRLAEILVLMKKYNLEAKRIRFLQPKLNENSNLVLIDARKNGNVGLKVLPPLICHNEDGSYSEEILGMFRR